MTTKEKKKINVKRTLHYFWQALMQYKVRTIFLLIVVPIRVFIFSIFIPRQTSNILGMLSAGNFELSNYIGTLGLLIGALALSNFVITRIADWLDWSLDAKCGEYLSQLSFNAIITQSMTFHSNHFSGSLTSQANKLTSAFIDLKSNFVWDIFPLFLTVIYSIITALIICPPFALILFLFVSLYVSAAIYTYVKTTHYDAALASAENKQTGQLADSVTNMISVKSYAREKFEKRRYERATGATKKAIFGLAKVSYFRNSILNIIGTITFTVIIILIILSHDLFNLSIANMIFLFSLSNSLTSEIWTVNHILRVVNRAFSNASEMVEILDLPFIVDDRTDKALKIKNAAIDFSHITFRHEEQKEKLFVDFNLEIPAGKTIGLVGVSGSGKSTLTKLLLRFADVKSGAIYIDGQDIRDITQNSLRESIAYVPQESSLFHRSVFENIAYGKPGATEEEVKRAAKLANADEFIKKLPNGYETMVGERGVKLSGGQRQRIAIARAILKNAPILVLDEATSALDSESEALIQEALNNLMKNRTSIVVAHRLSTIAGLDEIVVLDDGKIVEKGNHAELLKQGGEYAKLWSRQSGAFLEN